MTTLLQRLLRSFASTLGGQFATESPGQLLRIIQLAHRRLTFTQGNFEKLKTNFPGKHIQLFKQSYPAYQIISNEIALDANDYLLLFRSDVLTLNQKAEMIANMPPEMISKENADHASKILVSQINTTLTMERLEKLIILNSSNEVDVPLLLLYYPKLSKAEVKQLLSFMGNGFKKLLVKRKRPSVPNNENNRLLIQLLDRDNIIKSHKVEESQINITALYTDNE